MLVLPIVIDYARMQGVHEECLVLPTPSEFVGLETMLCTAIDEILYDSPPYWLLDTLVIRSEPPQQESILQSSIVAHTVPHFAAWVLRMPNEKRAPEAIWSGTLPINQAPHRLTLKLSDFHSGRVLPIAPAPDIPVCTIEWSPEVPIRTLWIRLTMRRPHRQEPPLVSARTRVSAGLPGVREIVLSSPHPSLTLSALSHLMHRARRLTELGDNHHGHSLEH